MSVVTEVTEETPWLHTYPAAAEMPHGTSLFTSVFIVTDDVNQTSVLRVLVQHWYITRGITDKHCIWDVLFSVTQ